MRRGFKDLSHEFNSIVDIDDLGHSNTDVPILKLYIANSLVCSAEVTSEHFPLYHGLSKCGEVRRIDVNIAHKLMFLFPISVYVSLVSRKNGD